MKKLKKNKGILFWITGLPGSGKTSIAEKIHNVISKRYGSTITISGDDLRKIFNYNKFSRKYRLVYALSYSKFCKYITDKNVNVIFSTVSLFHKVREWNKLNIFLRSSPLNVIVGPYFFETLLLTFSAIAVLPDPDKPVIQNKIPLLLFFFNFFISIYSCI